MLELIELRETIERERRQLDSMIMHEKDMDRIYEANIRLDRLIERYIEIMETPQETKVSEPVL